jgi:predicted O-methyltransferase YrrM
MWAPRFLRSLIEVANSPPLAGVLATAALARASRACSESRLPLAMAGGLTVAAGLHALHRLERAIRSAEDAAALAGMLGADTPLFGQWSADADFAAAVARELEREPELVVECGSGATTVVIASRLRRNNRGRLVTLEHDSDYAERTRRVLSSVGLDDVACVVTAPLRRQRIGGRDVAWYDQAEVRRALNGRIDLLIVDGPPQTTPFARWPALEALHPLLAPAAVILADDGRTRDALVMAHAWNRRFADVELYWLDTVKGTWMLRRTDRTRGRLFKAVLRVARTLNPRPSGFGRWPVRR